MESTYRRKRYGRYGSYNRNKKNGGKDDFVKNVTKQLFVCGIIFLVVLGVKSMNTPIANRVSNQIKSVLGYTIDINDAYKSVETFSQNVGLTNPKSEDKENEKQNTDPSQNQQDSIRSKVQKGIDAPEAVVPGQITNQNLEGALSLKDMERTSLELEKENIKIAQDIAPPLEGTITSKFGMRMHPVYQKEIFHYGIDIDSPKGADIVAVMDGEVVEAENDKTYGKFVKLKHQNDIYTLYAHCDTILVQKGQKIKKGQAIGKVGNSGVVLGVHLHFEMWKGDKVLDPMKYIQLPLAPALKAEGH